MFSDIQNHWSQDCIVQLANLSIVQGDRQGNFRPDDPLTRAGFAILITKALIKEEVKPSRFIFQDLSVSHWAYFEILILVQKRFFRGYPDGTIKPDQGISKVQAITVLASVLTQNIPNTPLSILRQYEDQVEIPDYAKAWVAQATLMGLVVNYPNSKQLNPTQIVTRGEAAVLLCQALKLDGVPPQYQVNLPWRSERNIDYTPLQNALASQNWRLANQLTSHQILALADQVQAGYLTANDTANLPELDLQTINLLWLKYSQGKFGFSTQVEIWRKLNGRDYNDSLYFEEDVGWKRGQPMFDLSSAPRGHLPFRPALTEGSMDAWGGWWIEAISQKLESWEKI